MKIEILFRGKSLDTGEWVEGYGVCVLPDKSDAVIIHRLGNNLMQHTAVDPETVGLIGEIYGQKITVGDILSCKVDGKQRGVLDVVEWRNGSLWLRRRYCPVVNFLLMGEDKTIEVVSNIHDNPELIQNQ